MKHLIPFLEELKARVGPILEQAGFELIREDRRFPEYVVYERKTGVTPRNDQIYFHGDEGKNCIRSYTVSGKKQSGLTTLKLLMPDFDSLDDQEKDGWHYENKKDLLECINEIAELVEDKVLDWFRDPVIPPPGKPSAPYLSERQITDLLHSHEQMAKKARAEGNIKDAVRHEYSAERYRKLLDE